MKDFLRRLEELEKIMKRYSKQRGYVELIKEIRKEDKDVDVDNRNNRSNSHSNDDS